MHSIDFNTPDFISTLCVTLVDEYGCADQDCFPFAKDEACMYEIHTSYPSQPNSPNSNHNQIPFSTIFGNFQSEYSVPDYLGTCYKLNPCGSGDNKIRTGPLVFYPNSSENPCESGGTLKCELCPESEGGPLEIEVPRNYGSVSFTDQDHCFCYFYPGLITDNNFIDATLGTSNYQNVNPYNLPVLAFYDCNTIGDPSYDPNSEEPQGPSCDQHECLNCEIRGNEEQCNYHIYCHDDEEDELLDVTPPGSAYYYCYAGNQIRRQCKINVCDFEVISLLPTNEYDLNDLLAQLPNPPGNYHHCENNICDLEDYDDYLTKCTNCPTVPFQPSDTGQINIIKYENRIQIDNIRQDELATPFKNQEYFGFDVLVYPNPFSNELNIKFLNKQRYWGGKILLADILGNTIISEVINSDCAINVHDIKIPASLPSGISMLFIDDGKGNRQSFKVAHILDQSGSIGQH